MKVLNRVMRARFGVDGATGARYIRRFFSNPDPGALSPVSVAKYVIRAGVLLVILLAGTSGALRAQGDPVPTSEAMLRPGDRVDINVFRNQELTGNYLVTQEGTLQHPLYASVRVGDIPLAEARRNVEDFLTRFEADPKFIFVPQFRIYVGGNVRDQNQFYLPEMTVGQAITRAGGSTAPTRRYRVRLIRDNVQTVANLSGSAEDAGLLQEEIRSGDQIIVEERPTFVRNYLEPSLRAIQTITGLVAAYVYLDAIFGSN